MMGKWREEMGDVIRELRGMKEWKEELLQMKEEVRDEIREALKEEIKKVRRELKEQKVKWKKEREKMRDCIKRLERRINELEGAEGGELEAVDVREGKRGGRSIVEDRLIKIERKIEMRKREERRRNIIIKGVQIKEGKKGGSRGGVENIGSKGGYGGD